MTCALMSTFLHRWYVWNLESGQLQLILSRDQALFSSFHSRFIALDDLAKVICGFSSEILARKATALDTLASHLKH